MIGGCIKAYRYISKYIKEIGKQVFSLLGKGVTNMKVEKIGMSLSAGMESQLRMETNNFQGV